MIFAGRIDEREELGGLIACRVSEIVPHNRTVVERACNAFLRVRKDRHRAWLNRGDFASYALAKTGANPFLFKDTDVARTEVSIAGPPA